MDDQLDLSTIKKRLSVAQFKTNVVTICLAIIMLCLAPIINNFNITSSIIIFLAFLNMIIVYPLMNSWAIRKYNNVSGIETLKMPHPMKIALLIGYVISAIVTLFIYLISKFDWSLSLAVFILTIAIIKSCIEIKFSNWY